ECLLEGLLEVREHCLLLAWAALGIWRRATFLPLRISRRMTRADLVRFGRIFLRAVVLLLQRLAARAIRFVGLRLQRPMAALIGFFAHDTYRLALLLKS